MAKRAFYQVTVAGQDISSTIAPLLLSLRLSIKAGDTGSSATIELDDEGGQLRFPRDGEPLIAALGWVGGGGKVVFKGTVDDVRSAGSRGGGRVLTITAKSVDTKSKAKENKDKHKDDASLEDAAKDFAADTGLKPRFLGGIGSGKRAYWSMQNESFLHWGQRIAKEIGASFRIDGADAIFSPRNFGSGSVTAAWGDNLIDWEIAPVLGRPQFAKTRARYFDTKEGKWTYIDVEVPGMKGAKASGTTKVTRADKDEAQGSAESDKKESERNKGEGSVTIDGNSSAEPEGMCVVLGARPGVDGVYRIEQIDHEINRSGGWTTKLSLKEPKGSAGADSR